MSEGTDHRVMRAHLVEFTSAEEADNFRAAAAWIEANPDTVVLAVHCDADDESESLTLTVQSADGERLDRQALKDMGAGIEERVARAVVGVQSFVQEMRDQGIHVGLGRPGRCVTCDEPWPCPASGIGARS